MTSRFFERRSFRNQLKTYLDARGWTDLTWAEGFGDSPLKVTEPPFIGVTLVDFGKDELQMGNDPTENKLYQRRVQINLYMEGQDRLEALEDEIMDFMDIEPIIIKDNSSNVLGSMISETSSIMSSSMDPQLDEEEFLQWRGIVACMYEVHYPEG